MATLNFSASWRGRVAKEYVAFHRENWGLVAQDPAGVACEQVNALPGSWLSYLDGSSAQILSLETLETVYIHTVSSGLDEARCTREKP